MNIRVDIHANKKLTVIDLQVMLRSGEWHSIVAKRIDDRALTVADLDDVWASLLCEMDIQLVLDVGR